MALGPDATGGLMSLRQGSRTVADYAIDFRTQGRRSNWNPAAQCDAFLHGLAPYIKDKLVSFDLPASLDGIIELTSRLYRRIQARGGGRTGREPVAVPVGACERRQPLQSHLQSPDGRRRSPCRWDAPV